MTMMRTVTSRIAPAMKMQMKNMSAVAAPATGVTKAEVLDALNTWGKGLVNISKTYAAKGDYKTAAINVLKNSYAFDISEVLFKPTLASNPTFRGTFDSAASYFIGGSIAEDTGFALIPWDYASFEVAGIITGEDHAILMGNKHLKKMDGSIVKANFTMAFIRDPKSGALKINVHHSSLPYTPAPAAK